MMPHIGAHVSAAGGAWQAIKRGEDIGADAIQIFGASPRIWKVNAPSEEEYEAFKTARAESSINEVFLHASYLVNLGSPNNRIFHGSISNLAAHYQICNNLGADGLIFHIGSHKDITLDEGVENVVKGMKKVLETVPGDSYLIMENSAGGGSKIGDKMKEIGMIFEQIDDPRVKVCIDTQHAYAAGVIEYTKDGVEAFAKECDSAFGLENLIVLHVNDSKTAHGSFHDRHENIGEGEIGLEGFSYVAQHPFFSTIPWILEVPGFDGNGPDAKNIDITRKLFV